MITVYTISGCIRSKKLKSALRDRQIEFEEKSFFSLLADPESFYTLMEKPENKEILFVSSGFADAVNVLSLEPEELMKKMMESPSVVRRPLALCQNEEEKKQLQFLIDSASSCKSESCLYYPFCPMPHDERGVGILSRKIPGNDNISGKKMDGRDKEAAMFTDSSSSASNEKGRMKDEESKKGKEEKSGQSLSDNNPVETGQKAEIERSDGTQKC